MNTPRSVRRAWPHDNPLARPNLSYTQSDRVDIVLTNPPFGGREADGIENNFPADLFLALIMRLPEAGRIARLDQAIHVLSLAPSARMLVFAGQDDDSRVSFLVRKLAPCTR